MKTTTDPANSSKSTRSRAIELLSTYGMVVVLLLLCLFFSIVTYQEQHPSGAAAGEQVAAKILSAEGASAGVLIVAQDQPDDRAFAKAAEASLAAAKNRPTVVIGTPRDARLALQRLADENQALDAIAATDAAASWLVISERGRLFPSLASAQVYTPAAEHWPVFLKRANLLNIANQIAVIAIVAIGATLVIITGGIDLSVGSLIALSAVVAALLIEVGGATEASVLVMIGSCLAAVVASGLVGLSSGALITLLRIRPFIVTLAMMLVARGAAYILARGQSVYQIPESFIWLGRGATRFGIPNTSMQFGIPNAVVLTILLYCIAHVLMSRTVLGRHIYAVGGNPRAAFLSGIPVKSVVMFAYLCSGALAGLGGVVMASTYRSGSPTYGNMYELYTIAAVVVGGTSLKGGAGRVFGTLVGALVIAVIQNGMNLTNVEPYTQMVVLGLVILGAVVLDTLRQRLLTGRTDED